MGTHAFTRKYRLVRPQEFQRVFQDPCRSGDKFLVMLARQNQLGFPRLGLAIARKAVHNAVARNRIKRAVRESFRTRIADLGGLDFVVTARAGCANQSCYELRVVLERHWAALVECKKS